MNKTGKQALFNRAITEAALEILGADEMRGLIPAEEQVRSKDLQMMSPIALIAQLGNEFCIRYHRNTAQGLLLRIGEAAFTILRQHIPELQVLGNLENRLQPLSVRFSANTQIFANILTQYSGIPVSSVKISREKYCLKFSDDAVESVDDLHNHFFIGLLRAYGVWMDSRKDYFLSIIAGENDQETDRVCFTIAEFE